VKNTILLLSISIFYLTSSVGYAKNKSELRLKLNHCSSIESDHARLVCFDKLVQPSAKQPVVAATVAVPSIVESKTVEQNKVDNFAKEDLKKTKEEQGPNSIFATVTKVKKSLKDQWVIYFENGQKWQQTNTARIKLKIGNKVRLEKGALGAVYLYRENSHRSIKVKRLK
jgi:hypothetical protein